MTTAVDTNALLALLYGDDYARDSEETLRRAYQEGRLVVISVVYSELAAVGHFETEDELDQFLEDFSIDIVDPSRAALFQAGQQFRRYSERRPDGLHCPSCGSTQAVTCESCGADLSPRQHIAADFLIGGHALADADGLITFDARFYQTYFPGLTVRP